METVRNGGKQWGSLFTGKIVQDYFTLESILGIGKEERRARNRLSGLQANISGEIYPSFVLYES
jgi:hypothetical protein